MIALVEYIEAASDVLQQFEVDNFSLPDPLSDLTIVVQNEGFGSYFKFQQTIFMHRVDREGVFNLLRSSIRFGPTIPDFEADDREARTR